MSLAILRFEGRPDCSIRHLLLTQSLASPLHLIAGLRKLLDAVIERNDLSNLVSYCCGIFEVHQVLRLGLRELRNGHRNLPFRPGLTDAATWNLGAEEYSSLCRGLRS